jgi:hypothetical protein
MVTHVKLLFLKLYPQKKFKDVFKEQKELPPHKNVYHLIILKPHTAPN